MTIKPNAAITSASTVVLAERITSVVDALNDVLLEALERDNHNDGRCQKLKESILAVSVNFLAAFPHPSDINASILPGHSTVTDFVRFKGRKSLAIVSL